MCRRPPRRIIVAMVAEPLEQLSPELVLVAPPEIAALARLTLPAPGVLATPTAATPAARRVFSLERAAALAAVYAAVTTVTLAPLALMLKAAPSPHPASLRVNDHLRAERHHAH
jgi:hypothetical protein